MFHVGAFYSWHPGLDYGAYGYAGVAFFFVLSGFVLAWSAPDPIDLRRFYRARFARIYPAYLVTLVACLVFVAGASWWIVASNVLLVQSWLAFHHFRVGLPFVPNVPTWSVSCEVFFYALLPLLLWHSKKWTVRTVCTVAAGWWVACSLVTAFVPGQLGSLQWSRVVYVNPVVRSGEFVLGIAAYRLVQSGRLPRLPVSGCIALVAVSYYLVWRNVLEFPRADVALTPSLVLLICAAAQADIAGLSGPLASRPLRYAGNISYSFYLVQYVPLHLVTKVHTSPLHRSVLAFVLTGAGAVVLHHVVERPAQRLIVGRRPTRAVGVAAPRLSS